MANTPMLLDHRGDPIKRSVLKQEIAGPSLTGVRTPMTGYPANGLNPVRLANILREADEGEPLRYLELAEQIEERDLHYAGVLGTRKRSVSQLAITVDAASDEARDVETADMVREWLLRDELADELFDVLDATGKGFSMTEIVWDSSEGQWRPERLEWRDPRWFRFDRLDGTTPLLRTDDGDMTLPAFKFIQARIKAKSGLPIRSGLARLATWSWMFKAFTMRDWAIFVQSFGQPIRVGKYGAGATEEDKDTLFRAVANIAGDCAAIIPESMNIEFISSDAPASNVKIYEERANWLDRQVSKAVLGQTATTDAIAGGHAVCKEHREVQEDIERADCRSLSAILNRDLVRPWVTLEYGPQARYPRLRIGREEERDVKLTVESVRTLVPMGLRVGAREMRDMVGLSEPDEDDEVLAAPSRQDHPSVPRDSEGGRGEDAALQSYPQGMRCDDCGRHHQLDAVVPSVVWNKIAPSNGVLCVDCIDARAASHGLDFEVEFYWSGKVGRSRLYDRATGRPALHETATRPELPSAEDLAAGTALLTAQAHRDLLARVEAIAHRADSLEDLRARIATMPLDAGQLATAMRQAFVLAEMSGRAEIAGDDSADGR